MPTPWDIPEGSPEMDLWKTSEGFYHSVLALGRGLSTGENALAAHYHVFQSTVHLCIALRAGRRSRIERCPVRAWRHARRAVAVHKRAALTRRLSPAALAQLFDVEEQHVVATLDEMLLLALRLETNRCLWSQLLTAHRGLLLYPVQAARQRQQASRVGPWYDGRGVRGRVVQRGRRITRWWRRRRRLRNKT